MHYILHFVWHVSSLPPTSLISISACPPCDTFSRTGNEGTCPHRWEDGTPNDQSGPLAPGLPTLCFLSACRVLCSRLSATHPVLLPHCVLASGQAVFCILAPQWACVLCCSLRRNTVRGPRGPPLKCAAWAGEVVRDPTPIKTACTQKQVLAFGPWAWKWQRVGCT